MFKIENEIKLIAIDMDGTLLNNKNEISLYTKEIIRLAQRKGLHIVLSTGRPLALCYEYHKKLGLSTDLVTANGAQIWSPDKKLLAEYTFESEIAEELWHYGDTNKHYMWMVAQNEMFRENSRPINFDTYEWVKLGYGKLTSKEKAIVLEKVRNYPELEITSSSIYNVEVNPRNVNKARGLQIVSDRLGISFDNMVAIGDSLNDKSMLEAAKIGVAMSNSIPEIIEIADVITDTNENDGVAKVIKNIINKMS